jgi:hypothetical protein
MTTSDFALSMSTVALSLIGSWMIALQMGKRSRVSSVQSDAVAHLLPALARIRELLHASAVRAMEPAEVAQVVVRFEMVCVQHGAVLPERVRHVQREVRSAVGNYFGGVSLAFAAAQLQVCSLSEPDPYWRDISVSYVDYVLRELKESAATPRGRRMLSFHDWRRDDDFDYRASRKAGAS